MFDTAQQASVSDSDKISQCVRHWQNSLAFKVGAYLSDSPKTSLKVCDVVKRASLFQNRLQKSFIASFTVGGLAERKR